MKQYTFKKFVRIMEYNDFFFDRNKGSHSIFLNSSGHHISVPVNLKCVIARRLIKENNLNINAK